MTSVQGPPSALLATRQRRQRLDQCRRLLLVATAAAGLPSSGSSGLTEPAPGQRCPHCGGSRIVRTAVPPQQTAAAASGCSTPGDTSSSRRPPHPVDPPGPAAPSPP